MSRRALLGSVVVVALGSVGVGTADGAYPGAKGKILVAFGGGGAPTLASIDPDGGSLQRITDGSDASVAANGGRIAFARPATADVLDVFVSDPDGSNVKQLTRTPDFERVTSISPDGTKVAFNRPSQDGAVQKIVVTDVSTGTETVLADGYSPAWSPDGSTIAFARFTRAPDSQVWLMDASGANQRPIPGVAGPLYTAGPPDWAPDGTRLALASGPNLMVFGPDGSEAATYPQGGLNRNASWSPDGSEIAFSHQGPGERAPEVFTIRPDGTGVAQATNTGTGFVVNEWTSLAPGAGGGTTMTTTAVTRVPSTQSLGSVLARGLRVPTRCATACSISSRLLASQATLKSARAVVVGKGNRRLTAAGKVRVVVKLTSRAKKSFRKHKRVRLTLRTIVSPRGGRSVTRSQRVTLKR